MNFSPAPPLKLMTWIMSLETTAPWDRGAWFVHKSTAEIVMMHTDISSASFHALSKEDTYIDLPRLRCGAEELWSMDGRQCLCTAFGMRLHIGKMRVQKFCRSTNLWVELHA